MINSSFKKSVYNQYLTYLMTAILLMGGAALAWWGYRFYMNRAEEAAFKDFAESVESFDKLITSHKNQAMDRVRLDDIERALEISIQKYGSSKLLPLFYLYKADVLIQKGDFAAASEALETSINKVEKDNPFYYLLLTKKALLKSDNDASRESGLEELSALSLDRNNPFGAMAAYNLGLHYYYLENVAKAKEIWQAALDRQDKAKECSWCELIRAKLEHIS